MQTSIFKEQRAWKAKSTVDINETLVLSITTTKTISDGALRSWASVGRRDGDVLRFSIIEDFHRDVLRTNPASFTAKVVEKQHNKAIEQIDNLIELAKKHYLLVA